jgi:hypothetical protein
MQASKVREPSTQMTRFGAERAALTIKLAIGQIGGSARIIFVGVRHLASHDRSAVFHESPRTREISRFSV